MTYRIVTVGLTLIGAAIVLAACVVIANRFHVPPELETAQLRPGKSAPDTETTELEIVTWNIGYAGMGRESDFVKDLGEQVRPLSRETVEKNVVGITHAVQQSGSDLFLFQEAARPSWVTYRVDVLGAIEAALPDYAMMFGADTDTRFVPPPFNIEVGNAIFSKVAVSGAERRGLPLEPEFELGIFRRGYRMHIVRVAGKADWVVVNIHLSAFDSEEDKVREKQIGAVLEFAKKEYALGRHVVIGGDWNLRLAKTEFPHRTEEKYLFWIRDLRPELTPSGWRWGTDPSTPTVRTAHKPFVAGENYQTIVDGFLVSPNVEIKSVKTENLGFQYSDHNPVRIVLRAL